MRHLKFKSNCKRGFRIGWLTSTSGFLWRGHQQLRGPFIRSLLHMHTCWVYHGLRPFEVLCLQGDKDLVLKELYSVRENKQLANKNVCELLVSAWGDEKGRGVGNSLVGLAGWAGPSGELDLVRVRTWKRAEQKRGHLNRSLNKLREQELADIWGIAFQGAGMGPEAPRQ